MGIYRLSAQSPAPQRISQPIEQLLLEVNTGEKTISMAWDDRFQGLHVFITTTAEATQDDFHFFLEMRTGAWWQDIFANKLHNPLCAAVFDGNLPDDRVTLIGSRDGYVRYLDPSALTDDGSPINSEVWLGPLLTKESDEVMFKSVQTILGVGSGEVDYFVHVGNTAEAAYNSASVRTGKWVAGRNLSNFLRSSGHAIYVRMASSDPWALEYARFTYRTTGPVRRRGI